jgi:hypothetical protein
MGIYRRVFTEGVDQNGDLWFLRSSGVPTFNAPQGSWCQVGASPDGAVLYQQTGSGTTNQWTLVSSTDIYDLGSISGEVTIDWDNASDQVGTVSDSITGLAFTNMQDGGYYTLELIAGAASKTIDWSDAVNKWFTSNNLAPTFSATMSKTDIYTFRRRGSLVFAWASQGA